VALVGQNLDVLDVAVLGTGAGTYACRASVGTGHVIANYQVDDPNDVVPQISQFGAGLLCDAQGFYQWYLDGSEILGANSSYHEPEQVGSYTVRVTSGEGCSALSAPFVVGPMGVEDGMKDEPAVVHPIGSTVLVISNAQPNSMLEVLDMTGRIVLRTGAQVSVDITFLSEGIYSASLGGRILRFVR
jgi:hypothetical protein